MKATINLLLRRHPYVTLILVLTFSLFIYLSWQLIEDSRLFREYTAGEQPIEPWMSPNLVAHSWDLSKKEMRLVLRLINDSDELPRTIETALIRSNMTLEELQLRVKIAQECDDFKFFDFDRDDDKEQETEQSKAWRKAAFSEICGEDDSDKKDKKDGKKDGKKNDEKNEEKNRDEDGDDND